MKCSFAYLDDHGLGVELVVGRGQDLLLDGGRRHQPQHDDLLLLPDAVCPGHGLLVILRVPVAVEEDDCVGALQV